MLLVRDQLYYIIYETIKFEVWPHFRSCWWTSPCRPALSRHRATRRCSTGRQENRRLSRPATNTTNLLIVLVVVNMKSTLNVNGSLPTFFVKKRRDFKLKIRFLTEALHSFVHQHHFSFSFWLKNGFTEKKRFFRNWAKSLSLHFLYTRGGFFPSPSFQSQSS